MGGGPGEGGRSGGGARPLSSASPKAMQELMFSIASSHSRSADSAMAEESFESLWLKIPAEMRDEWLFSGCGKGDAETSGGVLKKERKGKERRRRRRRRRNKDVVVDDDDDEEQEEKEKEGTRACILG